MNNTTAYVVDESGNLAPRGTPGELFVTGLALSMGYYQRERLTDERFLTDPLGNSSNVFFRTGDCVRMREDGTLEFIGRLDDQLKLRGERIEPGEIAAVILSLPGITDCVVSIAENAKRNAQLVAYYVGTGDSREERVRAQLQQALPKSMVPSGLMRVAAIPRNINGKPAISELPPITRQDTQRIPPTTDTEQVIAGFWRELLGLDDVGVLDDFVQLGGDSLVAVRLISRINAAFDIDLPISDAFQQSTVRALAQLVENVVVAEIRGMSNAEVEEMINKDPL